MAIVFPVHRHEPMLWIHSVHTSCLKYWKYLAEKNSHSRDELASKEMSTLVKWMSWKGRRCSFFICHYSCPRVTARSEEQQIVLHTGRRVVSPVTNRARHCHTRSRLVVKGTATRLKPSILSMKTTLQWNLSSSKECSRSIIDLLTGNPLFRKGKVLGTRYFLLMTLSTLDGWKPVLDSDAKEKASSNHRVPSTFERHCHVKVWAQNIWKRNAIASTDRVEYSNACVCYDEVC